MTTKTEQAAAERKVMDRYEKRIYAAYADAAGPGGYVGVMQAYRTLRILRASAAALFPGRQNRRHLLPALGKMVTAACRVIRKGGGK